MVFESQYRRKAMAMWEASGTETKEEMVAAITCYQGIMRAAAHMFKVILSLLRRSAP